MWYIKVWVGIRKKLGRDQAQEMSPGLLSLHDVLQLDNYPKLALCESATNMVGLLS